MKKYNLNLITGSPGDMEENINWNHYKNIKPESINVSIFVEDCSLLDNNINSGKASESFGLTFLNLQ